MDTGGEEGRPPLRFLEALDSVDSLLRMVRAARDALPGEDLETAIIMLTVWAASSGQYRAMGADNLTPLRDEDRAPISRRRIADSTGLPRETVRRKLARLAEIGMIAEADSGVFVSRQIAAQTAFSDYIRLVIAEFKRMSGRLGAD